MISRILFVILLATFFSGCSEKKETPADIARKNNILLVANGNEPRELDPNLTTGSPEHNILKALFEGLTTREPRTLEVKPGVAESWEISEDGKRYTFSLRKDAKWSNGDPVTAEDFVYSWQRSLTPALGSEWAYMKYYIKNAKAFHSGELKDFSQVGVRAQDPYTLVVELNNATHFFLQILSHNSYFPVHKATIEAHAAMDQPISQWTRPENFVGNGPFVLTEWKINEVIQTERNTHYWDTKNVPLNGVHFFPISDQQAEVRAYRSGQVHLTYSPTMAIEKIAFFKKNDPEALRVTTTFSTYYYEANVTRPPLDDPRVRRALALAIDRKLLAERVSKGGQTPAYNLVPSVPGGYQPPPLFSYDPDKARALLAEAGYPNGEGFPKVELLYNTQDDHRKIALAVQQMFKDTLNIDIQLANQEWKVYLNTKRNLQHDIARAGWIADYLDPSNFLEILYSKSGNNDTGWKSAEYDAIIEKLAETSNSEARNALFDQASALLVEEMPIIPIYNYSDLNVVSPLVRGWHDNVMHYHPYNRVHFAPENE